LKIDAVAIAPVPSLFQRWQRFVLEMAGRSPEKQWRDALRAEVNELIANADGVPVKKLRAIAAVVVSKALRGDMLAVREIADRLDGKSAQAVALGAGEEAGEPLQIVIKQMVDTSGKPVPPRSVGQPVGPVATEEPPEGGVVRAKGYPRSVAGEDPCWCLETQHTNHVIGHRF
jgi:hypothetical protein